MLVDEARAIAVIHIGSPHFPVPPTGYGGVERAISDLLHAQSRQRSLTAVLLAPSTSEVPCKLVPIDKRTTTSHAVTETLRSIADSLVPDDPVIHVHDVTYMSSVRDSGIPAVVSIYNDVSRSRCSLDLQSMPSHWRLIANSAATRRKRPEWNWSGVIHEGVDLAHYPYSAQKNRRLVFIGECIEEKGLHTAVRLARGLHRPLDIIGRTNRPELPLNERARQEAYLAQHVWPYVDGKRIRYLGELGRGRLDVLRSSSALLAPVTWEEPFGRILIESMACGTPVIAFNRGAVSEVVDHEITGYVVETADEMANAISQLHKICPRACRDHVAQRFSADRVARDYFLTYAETVRTAPC